MIQNNLLPSSYDYRDYRYSANVSQGLPNTVSLKEYAGVIEDQQWTNSCVGHAITTAMELLIKRAGTSKQLSRLFAYWISRSEEERRTDSGTSIRIGIRNISKFGVCDEDKWAFDPVKVNVQPDQPSFDDAASKKIFRYSSIGVGTDYDIMMMKAALAEGYPVVIGMYMTPFNVSGAHAMTIVGYDMDGFIVENSWGKSWGDNGYCNLSFEDAKKYVFETWVIEGVTGYSVSKLWTPPDTRTRVFLAPGEAFTVSNSKVNVYGARPSAVIINENGFDCVIDQNVKKVILPFIPLVSLALHQTGNVLHMYYNNRKYVSIAIDLSGIALEAKDDKYRIGWAKPGSMGVHLPWQQETSGLIVSTAGPQPLWLTYN